MNSRLIIFLVLLSCCYGQVSPIKVHNIGYVTRGYNILKGDPLENTVDPGFTNSLFNLKYKGQKSEDERFEIPDNVDLQKISSCNTNFNSEESTTEKSYLDTLGYYAEVKGGLFTASFSASKNYKRVKDEKTRERYFHLISTSECTVYKASLLYDEFPDFIPTFKNKILEKLPEAYDKEEYFHFIDSYGTHYVTEVWMGSRRTVVHSIKESDRYELMSKNVDIQASASLASRWRLDGSRNQSSQDVSNFTSKVQRTQSTFIGSPPLQGMETDGWAQQVNEEPMPIKYTLSPIYELIKAENFNATSRKSRIQKIQQNIQRALSDYCENLKRIKPELTCKNPSEVQELKSEGKCAICAQKCGGIYSEESGKVTLEMTLNMKTLQTFGSSCAGKLSNDELNGGNARFCCKPQPSQQKVESCKMCSSCGGVFNKESGKVGPASQFNIFSRGAGDSCSGDTSERTSQSGFSLCCTQTEICSLCSSCGGKFQYDNGNAVRFFAIQMRGIGIFSSKIRGAQCSGALVQGMKPMPSLARLCCSNQKVKI